MSSKKTLPRILAFAMLAFASVEALAHTHLEKASPAKGSVLDQLPDRIRLEFSEGIEPTMSKLEVKNITTGETVSDEEPAPGADSASGSKTLEVSLRKPKKAKGKYKVTWKAISTDTHKNQGSYEFVIEPKNP